MKIKIYKICKIINIVCIINLLIIFFIEVSEIKMPFIFDNVIYAIILCTIIVITWLFWIYNYYIYYVKDKSSVGLKLFFFNIFYTPFYTKKVLKNGWL
jgi:hypothetical protein